MAIIGMTEADLQAAIHTLYETDATPPTEGDDDYTIRRNLINIMVNRWENNTGTLWNELWTQTTTTPIVSGDSTYAAPSNFRFPGGYIKIYNGTTLYKTYRVIKPEEAQAFTDSSEYAYFTGSPNGGYTLNLNPVPGDDMNGFTIKYDYYKRATKLDATTVTSEMNDPYYLVWGVVAELHKSDNNIALYQAALSEAEERLKQMVIQNQMYANYQDWGMQDQQQTNLGGQFGV